MCTRALIPSLLAAALLGSAPARADPVCTTVDGFNAAMAQGGTAAASVSLTFDLTGVNPAEYWNGKGSIAQLRDTRCGLGAAEATLKLYGVSDPPNLSHPAGTLKQEYGDPCCGEAVCGEGWADPGTSAAIFVDGTETCTGEIFLDATQYGYALTCNSVTYSALGVNTDGIGVTEIHFLYALDAGGGTIWEMSNATSTWNQVCYEAATTPGEEELIVPVAEDVTAAQGAPDTVYADVNDLAVGFGDSEFFLKFVVAAVPGRVTGATVHLRAADDGSAQGDGGDLLAVPDSTWSELTLTWNGRPAPAGASLARLGAVSPSQWYVLDAATTVTGPGTYSFAVVPQATDLNSAHLRSKEAGLAGAPYLRLTYVVVDDDSDGSPDGPDCDDANPAVHPGATELCNGLDDDCDGTIDEGCPGGDAGVGDAATGDAATGDAATADAATADAATADAGTGGPGDVETGCACGAAPGADLPGLLLLVGGVALALRRRRRPA